MHRLYANMTLFYIRGLSMGRFWYPGESWNQFPADRHQSAGKMCTHNQNLLAKTEDESTRSYYEIYISNSRSTTANKSCKCLTDSYKQNKKNQKGAHWKSYPPKDCKNV